MIVQYSGYSGLWSTLDVQAVHLWSWDPSVANQQKWHHCGQSLNQNIISFVSGMFKCLQSTCSSQIFNRTFPKNMVNHQWNWIHFPMPLKTKNKDSGNDILPFENNWFILQFSVFPTTKYISFNLLCSKETAFIQERNSFKCIIKVMAATVER